MRKKNFNITTDYGFFGELIAIEWLKQQGIKVSFHSQDSRFPYFDIKVSNTIYNAENKIKRIVEKCIEVKRDYKCLTTGNIAIEVESNGVPSGISTSMADFYIFIIDNITSSMIKQEQYTNMFDVYMISKKNLIKCIESSSIAFAIRGGYSNLSKFWCVPLSEVQQYTNVFDKIDITDLNLRNGIYKKTDIQYYNLPK